MIHTLSKKLNNGIEKFLVILAIVMSSVVTLQVFCRYMLNNSLFWSEEVARIILIWITFLGSTVAYYRNLHPSVDFIIQYVNKNTKKIMSLVVCLISIIFFIILMFQGVKYAYFVRLQVTPAMSIPKWMVYSMIPFSGGIFLVHGLSLLIVLFQDFKNGN